MTAKRDHAVEEKITLEGGSQRSVKKERFDLIPIEALVAYAQRAGLGAEKYGDDNWKRGGVEMIKSCFNHLLAHYTHLIAFSYDSSLGEDDDVAAMIWNVGALAWFRVHKKEEYNQARWEMSSGKQAIE